MTPTEHVNMAILDHLAFLFRIVLKEHTFRTDCVTPAYAKRLAKVIAQKHNRLLDKSGFDGLHLEVPNGD